ncbi:TonB-dependent receptor domain-containing protein [Pseudarcicella hirudinis]|uniref:TonB-dependent receptor domain-containing protein n=1 Tax=Pseudarcicella hirudinis TaxID=1079859 RepID=UPI0035E6C0B3
MILNVEASPITSGLTGLELLEKVPGITVDKNSETIKLKGKSGVLVMIDDRQTYLSEEQLAAFLKTLKSDDIEKIEVITNPSARYDAAGATGIINIKTKKGKNFGTNYILDLGLGYSSYKEQGNFPKNSQGITMSTKKEKFALYANVSRNYNTWFNTQNENQRLLGESQELDETRINKGLNKGANGNWNAKVGLDYDLSKNTVVGITALAAISDNNMTRTTDQLSQTSSLTQQINMIRNQIGENRNYTFNTHLKQTFDTSGTSLNVDFDMIFNRDYNNSLFKTTTIANENQTLVNNQIIAPSNTHTFVLKSDFIKNLSKKVKLETGFKTSFSSSDKDFDDNFRDNGALVNSFFRFKENINAGYVMLNSELTKKLNLQLGLRGEQTNTLGEDRLGNQISKQNYFNLFPTVSLNQKVTKDYTVSLGYSRRINRPWANNFNTFKRFYSPFQYFEGNPNILPSLNNSISLTHTFKDAFSFSFSFVNVDQFASDVYDVDTTYIPGKRLVRESFENIKGKVNWWSFDVSLPFNVTKWWNVNINIWSGINVYNYQRADAVVNVSQPYGGTYIQQTFTLTKTLTAELSGFVTSGETWGFETGNRRVISILVSRNLSGIRKEPSNYLLMTRLT